MAWAPRESWVVPLVRKVTAASAASNANTLAILKTSVGTAGAPAIASSEATSMPRAAQRRA